MSGQKIIEGLRDATTGNVVSVTIEGQLWVRVRKAEALKPAMVSAVELEIEAVLGRVTTRRIGELIQVAVDEVTKGYGNCTADQAEELTRLQQANAALVEALKPFADYAGTVGGSTKGDELKLVLVKLCDLARQGKMTDVLADFAAAVINAKSALASQ